MRVENFIQKYLPVQIQRQIGESINKVFNEGDIKLVRYKDYENAYEARQTSAILKDNGVSDLRVAMKELYEDFLVKQAQFLSEEDSNNELA